MGWEDWRDSRANSGSGTDTLPQLDDVTNEQLSYWLCRFVVEAQNQGGLPYTGGALYGLCAGIQRYVREKRALSKDKEALDIYKDPSFTLFTRTFDSVLKELHQQGIGTTKRQAQVISGELEESMWTEGVLGNDTPEKLLDTLVFCFGLNFALRSGKEHRNLKPAMLEYKEPSDSSPYLMYNEYGSKNNPGGLKGRKWKNKCVKVFPNLVNPDRCVIALYKKYTALCPPDAPLDAFYLHPLRKPKPTCWYQPKPVGHNILSKTVKKLTDKVGAVGLRIKL